MIPLRDDNPTSHPAIVTWLIIGACVVVYFFIQPHATTDMSAQVEEVKFSYKHAAVPCEITQGHPLSEQEVRQTLEAGDDSACFEGDSSPRVFPDKNIWFSILYSMFLHGSVLHIAGNMLYLWVFGNNIEDVMGKVPFIVFYFAAGLVATFAHIVVQPNSTVPVVGASGAIAGVMGAYFVLFPNVPIRSLLIIVFIPLLRDIPAKWLLGFWFVLQFFTDAGSGVAWVAHVGGFIFGALVGLAFRHRLRPRHAYWRAGAY